jgi:hypothetical protein
MEQRSDLYGHDADNGWTKAVLVETAGISTKTFDTLRKAARVKGPSHGGLNWVFNAEDLIRLIRKAESGNFTERGRPAANAWRTLLTERGLKMPEEP